jgi:hypothetical protein
VAWLVSGGGLEPLDEEEVNFALVVEDEVDEVAGVVGPKVHLRTAPVGLSSWWGLPFHGVSSRVARTSARWGSASAGSAVIWSDTAVSGMMRYTR